MDIVLFCIFVVISFTLIALGLFRTEHTELALIGLVFLFLLAMLVLNNDSLTYKVGTNTSSNFTYTYSPSANGTLLTSSFESVTDIYEPITLGNTLSHTIGYWLAVGSVIAFIGVLLGLRKSKGWF